MFLSRTRVHTVASMPIFHKNDITTTTIIIIISVVPTSDALCVSLGRNRHPCLSSVAETASTRFNVHFTAVLDDAMNHFFCARLQCAFFIFYPAVKSHITVGFSGRPTYDRISKVTQMPHLKFKQEG